ncbi:MAG TPA: hypothetical protein VMJ34_16435 [Bryobacteraceae bacterium]|nr:hypothetical protein [Bryobacteraceae bacterium]
MADILGGRKFVEVPGSRTHELPPLLLRSTHQVRRLDRVVNMASNIVEEEEMVAAPEPDFDRRRMDLALNLVDQYQDLLQRWSWGDSILEWIRQCEMTFETRLELRNLLRNDVWPHAGRSSFVQLLADKALPEEKDVDLEKAVGLRLTFRQPPPISCFSNQFLFYLKHTVASSAWQAWVNLTPSPIAALPPERFTFRILNTSLE